MPRLHVRLENRLKGEHMLFPLTTTGGAILYLLLAATLAVSARVSVLTLFGDAYILASGTLAFAAFWGGAGILATMGYPRVLMAASIAHALAYLGLVTRVIRGDELVGTDAALAIVNVFTWLALGVLTGLAFEGYTLWHRHKTPQDAHDQTRAG